MSYIRATSGPEGLYAFQAADDRGRMKVHMIPGHAWPLTNASNDHPILVPPATFEKAVGRWEECSDGEDGVREQGLEIREVHVFADDGKPVPKNFNALAKDARKAEFMIRVSFRGRWVLLWRVTWAYVVHNVLGDRCEPDDDTDYVVEMTMLKEGAKLGFVVDPKKDTEKCYVAMATVADKRVATRFTRRQAQAIADVTPAATAVALKPARRK